MAALGFSGTFHPRLDDKSRLTLPAKFRVDLAGGVVVTKGPDHCLEIFPAAAFAEKAERAARAARSSREALMFKRNLAAGADDQVPDGQGRITLSAEHRRWAGLGKDCTVTGAWDTVEVWDSAAWQELLASTEDYYAHAVEAGAVEPGVPG